MNQELFEQIKTAFIDVVDGQDQHDLVYATGLSETRCREIIDLFNQLVESSYVPKK